MKPFKFTFLVGSKEFTTTALTEIEAIQKLFSNRPAVNHIKDILSHSSGFRIDIVKRSS